jgi:hypothetical protein
MVDATLALAQDEVRNATPASAPVAAMNDSVIEKVAVEEPRADATASTLPPLAKAAKGHWFRVAMPRSSIQTLALCGAAICLTLGSAGLVGSEFFGAPAPVARTADLDTALPWRRDKVLSGAETAHLKEELRTLHAEVQTARANLEQARTQEAARTQDLRMLRAALEAAKTETASVKADLTARLDRADQVAQASGKLGERVDRIERRLADPVVTSSIARPETKPELKADAKPEPKAVAEPPKPMAETPKPVQGYVLRDVYRGVALIETRRGMIEVATGDSIPGAGRVQSIERHAGKWRVVTTNGFIDDLPE